MNTTTYREITEEAERRGRVEGLREGRVEHARAILLRMLALKFAQALPMDLEERVAAAEVSQVDQWLERLVTAASLAEVFE